MAALPLILDGVSYAAGDLKLIEGVSLEIAAGPKTLILGPNGSGKSLLLRLCHGLIRPSRGSIRWAGDQGRDVWRRQAMVFQKPVMLRRSVRANVAYGVRLRGVAAAPRRATVERALARVGLSGFAGRPARVLSGGERQRLALARAWALEPEVLFLDEPTASLDPGASAAVEAIIEEFHRAGTKIVMTTHDLAQARRLADEIVFLDRGRVAERSPAEVFFSGPASEAGAAFLDGRLLW